MITKIELKKNASYGDTSAVLETDKRINLIYGLNGSGKTTLSNFLASKNGLDFPHCYLEGYSDEKILVYNYNFIQNNFYIEDRLKGIFTLSSENKEAEEKIKEARLVINNADLQLNNIENNTGAVYDLKAKKSELEDLRTSAEEKIWEIKTEYTGGDRVLEYCLFGLMGSKGALFRHITGILKPSNKPTETIEALKKETESTQGAAAKKYDETEISEVVFDFSEIEDDPIFSEVIIGNKNSTISGLIKELDNNDWVKQGTSYLKKPEGENVQCPFCQEETVTKELYDQIINYFDATYQQKIDRITLLEDQYWKAYTAIPEVEKFLQNTFIKNKEDEFRLLYKNLTDKLRSNWSKIKDKKTSSSKYLSLESTKTEIDDYNIFLSKIIDEIIAHNLKIDNKEKTKSDIKEAFWQIMRWDYDQTIENYILRKSNIQAEIDHIQGKIVELENNKESQKKIIQEQQKKIVNIDEAVENINYGLKDLGSVGFQIVKVNKDFYQIKRGNEAKNQFKTLSEGKKTIISFLYFLELCKGKEKEDEVVTNKIVVIDDPVSSLSHIYIFNLSQSIKYNFFDKPQFKQIFVLTHSLYFFHELLKYGKDDLKKMFRIIKSSSGNSFIYEMGKGEIQNDYQSYWQILKDHNNGNAPDALLANCMRNILEYFFGFIEKEKYKEALENLDQQKYQAFVRYIDRESHSDFVNISDTKEIDPSLFKSAFKEIFEKSGYEKHYNKMMNII